MALLECSLLMSTMVLSKEFDSLCWHTETFSNFQETITSYFLEVGLARVLVVQGVSWFVSNKQTMHLIFHS